MKKVALWRLLFLACLFVSFNQELIGLDLPIFPPPANVRNIMLVHSDLPQGFKFYANESTCQSLVADGWLKENGDKTINDVIPGISHSWQKDDLFVSVRYGYFDSSNAARYAADGAIFQDNDALLRNVEQQGSFSGISIGEHSSRWEWAFEEGPGREIRMPDEGLLAFCKGRYAVLLNGAWENSTYGTKDKTVLDTLAQKIEKKIDIATTLDSFPALQTLVSQKGILHSLQVKLDNFTKNYREGDYKVALNNINSFLNELEAQRGKHVSEAAYQTLKSSADAIIQALNSLM